MNYTLDQIAWFIVDNEKFELNILEQELKSISKTSRLLRLGKLGIRD